MRCAALDERKVHSRRVGQPTASRPVGVQFEPGYSQGLPMLRTAISVLAHFDPEVDDDGRITLWRDYVDRLDFFVIAPLRALAALVIPSLRPTM
jgi:uncharacterized protein YcaQ